MASIVPAITVRPGAASTVPVGGVPVIALFGSAYGGLIVNPQLASDQEVEYAGILYVDPVNPASDAQTATTVAIQPGESYFVPAETTAVSVNAKRSGHAFTSLAYTSPTPYPPTPTNGPFPPSALTVLTAVIPSYLYEEYSDDSDLQAFVAAYNSYAQNYIDTFNALNLPIYTATIISGPLLDWVAQGIYGIQRPALGMGQTRIIGPFDTYEFNTFQLNAIERIGPADIVATSDDTFKRVLTWHFFKGDGHVFDVRWLKRRIMRFLLGTDGTAPNIDETYQISVTFGTGGNVAIRFIDQITSILAGAILNTFEMNTMQYNELETEATPLTPLPYRMIFQEAVAAGVLELPFEYSFTVVI